MARWDLVAAASAVAVAAGALPAGALTVPLPEAAESRLVGAERGGRAGTTVAAAGDFDGDGFDDLVTGGRNVAYLVLGGSAGVVDTGDDRVVRFGFTSPERRQDVSVAGAGDVDGDGFDDVLLGASRMNEQAGTAFLVYGRPDPADLVVDDSGATRVVRIEGAEAKDRAGSSVASAGDATGDGVPDVVVGAPVAGARDRGATYVLSGAALTSHQDLASLGAAGYRIHSPAFGKDVGYSVSTAGDVNADGLDDLITGAPADLVTARPAAYVVFGQAGGGGVELRDLEGKGWAILGSRDEDHEGAGKAVSGGHDVNGDGTPDVVVGAPSATGPFGHGAAFVVFGKSDTATVDLDELGSGGFRIHAGADGFEAGRAVALAPDHDGNGFADVLVGDPFERRGLRDGTLGAAYHLVGQPGTETIDLGRLGRDGVRYVGAGDDHTGASVAAVGDFDGDGRADLAAGAPADDGAVRRGGGGVYLFAPAEAPANDRPPRAMLLSYTTRQRAVFGSYCWDGLCVDRRPEVPKAEPAGSRNLAHFRILYREKPDDFALTAYRQLDEFGRPTGAGRDLPSELRPVRHFQGAPVAAWEVVFRLPRREGHLYLSAFARWQGLERGDASWFSHLRLDRSLRYETVGSAPDALLVGGGARQQGVVGPHCWGTKYSDGTGSMMCIEGVIRPEGVSNEDEGERARAGARAFVRLETPQRPDRIGFRFFREGYRTGEPRRVTFWLRRHRVDGRTKAWEIRFILPRRPGNLYPGLNATWGHNRAPYDWHLVLHD